MKEDMKLPVVASTSYTFMEITKPISPEYPDYSASESGNIYSHKWNKFRLIKPRMMNGYWFVTILNKDSKKKTIAVHRLTLTAFKGEPPFFKNVCRHINGNRTDNHVSNLKWGTHKENSDDRTAHGRKPMGEKTKSNSLLSYQIIDIFNLYVDGLSIKKISKILKVSATTIQKILLRKSWPHIEIPEELERKAREKVLDPIKLGEQTKFSEKFYAQIFDFIRKSGEVDFAEILKAFPLSRATLIKAIYGKQKRELREKFMFNEKQYTKTHRSGIDDADISAIFLLHSNGLSINKIAKKFLCDKKTIKLILLRKTRISVEVDSALVEKCHTILNKKNI